MFDYIEVIEKKTSKVVHRVDVTGKSERLKEQVERGMLINMSHEFFTIEKSYETKQELKP
jgi:hypothetical protein